MMISLRLLELLQSEPDYLRGVVDQVIREIKGTDEAAEQVYHRASARIVEMFRPLYDRSGGTLGFVTIQDDPRFDDDTEHIVDMTMRCTKLGPNFMTKIPVIGPGIAAIEELATRNIPICATEIFAVSQAIHVCEAYERAAKRSGKYPPFYLTHITGIFDEIGQVVKAEKISIAPDILAQAGCIIARKEYQIVRDGVIRLRCWGRGSRHEALHRVRGRAHAHYDQLETAEELIAATRPGFRIDTPTPKDVVEELRAKIPGFSGAFDEDGLAVQGFADFGPLMFFKTMFLNGYARLLDEVAHRRARTGA